MGHLEKNLETIKRNDIELYKTIKKKLKRNIIKEQYFENFDIVIAKNGEKIIEVYDDAHNCIRLNSLYNPEKEAKRWVNRFNDIKNVTSLIMFGIGNGIFCESVREIVDKAGFIFLYEPSIEMLLFCMENFDLCDILSDTRVTIYIENINDKDFLYDLSVKINWAMLSSQVVCFHPMYDKIYNEQYEKFMYIIEQFKIAVNTQKNTSLTYAKQFTINALKNLHFIKNSNYISEFIGMIDSDVPVIIVSAGPSLDKNIDQLRKAENKAFILATDTAVKYLLLHDIKFDAIVTVDGRKSVIHLQNEACAEYPIFTVPDARNEVLESNSGRKIWINSSGYMGALYQKYEKEFPEYVSGGSVATAAFWVAKVLKVKTIILIGQDLAYDGEKTHAGNITYQYTEWKEEKDIFIEDIFGNKIKTRLDWLGYLRWFENMISQYEDEITVIDATEGGAKISGTVIMKLSDAIFRYCKQEFDFNNIIKNLPVTFSSKEYKQICEEISHIKKECEQIREAAQDGIQASKSIIFMIENNLIYSEQMKVYMEKIGNSEQIIQNQNIYLLLDEYISADIVDRLELAAKKYDSQAEQLLENARSFQVLFKALIKAVDELLPIIFETLQKL